jgi:hypothetical protein
LEEDLERSAARADLPGNSGQWLRNTRQFVWLKVVRGGDPHELPVDFVKVPAPSESDFVPDCSSDTPLGTTSFEVRQALDRPVL